MNCKRIENSLLLAFFKIPRVAAFFSFSWGNLYSYTPERFHIEISKSLGAAKTFQVLGFCPLGAKTPAPHFSKFPAFANFAKANCSLIKPWTVLGKTRAGGSRLTEF